MISIVVGLIALAVALMLSSAIGKAPAGTARMQEIAGYIHEGAMAFLFREYKALSAFVIVVAIVISMFLSPLLQYASLQVQYSPYVQATSA